MFRHRAKAGNRRAPAIEDRGVGEDLPEARRQALGGLGRERRARFADALSERASIGHERGHAELERLVQHERERLRRERRNHGEIERLPSEVRGRERSDLLDREPARELVQAPPVLRIRRRPEADDLKPLRVFSQKPQRLEQQVVALVNRELAPVPEPDHSCLPRGRDAHRTVPLEAPVREHPERLGGTAELAAEQVPVRGARDDDRGGEVELAGEIAAVGLDLLGAVGVRDPFRARNAMETGLDAERAVAEGLLAHAKDARTGGHRVVQRDDRRNPLRGGDLDEVAREPDPVVDVNEGRAPLLEDHSEQGGGGRIVGLVPVVEERPLAMEARDRDALELGVDDRRRTARLH